MNFPRLGWIAVAAGAISVWLGNRVQVHEVDSAREGLSRLDGSLAPPGKSSVGLPALSEG